jgi:hypothetical protein
MSKAANVEDLPANECAAWQALWRDMDEQVKRNPLSSFLSYR